MASVLPVLLVLVLLTITVIIPPTSAARCTHSTHCKPNHPTHVPFCVPHHGLCLSLPNPALRQRRKDKDQDPQPSPEATDPADAQQPDITFTTLSRLINDTNAIDFPLSAKREAIATVKKVYNGFNPHKFLHENLLQVDFPAALDALDAQLKKDTTNVQFFNAMTNAFQLMDDKHSVFLLPYPFNASLATLGFFPKIFYDKDSKNPMRRRYAVADLLDIVLPENSSLTIGSELLTFDGQPIDKVVRRLGKNSYASNNAARIDTGLQLLAFRALIGEQIPFKPSVKVGFVNPDGKQESATLDWIFAELSEPEMAEAVSRQFLPSGPNPIHRKKSTTLPSRQTPIEVDLSTPESVSPQMLNSNVRVVAEGRVPIEISPSFRNRFSAEIIATKNGPIGRFVLPDFNSEATPELVAELARVFKLLPKNGLIMDLRANGGGDPNYVKVLVETLVGKSPPQFPTVLRATQLMKKGFDGSPTKNATKDELSMLSAFRAAVRTSIEIAEPFTGPTVGLYSPEFERSSVERVYFGPIVTLTDGLCYSAGDLFTSLQKDLGYSLVVGVSDNVGAGGASTLSYQNLLDFFPTVLEPTSVAFTTSFARFYRTGKKNGAIMENFGVKPDIRYYPTFKDATEMDCDLFEFLGELLAGLRNEAMQPLESPEADINPIPPSPEEIM